MSGRMPKVNRNCMFRALDTFKFDARMCCGVGMIEYMLARGAKVQINAVPRPLQCYEKGTSLSMYYSLFWHLRQFFLCNDIYQLLISLNTSTSSKLKR